MAGKEGGRACFLLQQSTITWRQPEGVGKLWDLNNMTILMLAIVHLAKLNKV